MESKGLDTFSIRCQTQWHLARTLSLAFIRYFAFALHFCIYQHLSLNHFSSIFSELLSSNDSFSLQRNILRSILSSMSSQDCRFFMEQGNEQCELFQRAHIFVRFKNSSHPINWINLYANDTKHQRYASWTLEQHEGDLAVHNVLEPQSLALGMI